MNRVDIAITIDDSKAIRFSRREFGKGAGNLAMISGTAPAYGIDLVSIARSQPCSSPFERHRQQYRQVGQQAFAPQHMERPNRVVAQFPSHALIRSARIDVTIANDPVSLFQRGTDEVAHMICAGCGEQHGFGPDVPPRSGRIEEKAADRFRPRGSTGFAGQNHGNAARFKSGCELSGLGRFACPLPAFQSDEAPLGHGSQAAMPLITRCIGVATAIDRSATSGRVLTCRPSIETMRSATCSPFATGARSGPS